MKRISTFAMAILSAVATHAHASCGSAFCSLNTDWEAQGAWTESGWRADARYEYINQDQPRTGTRDVAVGEIPRHHDEVYTVNRNLLLGLSYAWSPTAGLTVTLPLIDRKHYHVHNHHGAKLDERWDFRKPGDVRVVGHYDLADKGDTATPSNYGVLFGVKLPTGKINVANDEGEEAERTLQPGTGTVDVILGAYYRRDLPDHRSSVFTQLTVQAPLNERDGFRPSKTLVWDAGYRYNLSGNVRLNAQLNYAAKSRDAGVNAEPADAGSRVLSLSPGINVSLTRDVQAYGYVQLPIYQNVNGVQLVAARSFVLGVSTRF